MDPREEKVRITRLQLSNFKGFSNFSLTLEPMTMLVGPNNAGKSTIVGAFRALSVALRTGRSRNAQALRLEGGNFWGHRIAAEAIPISLENAQHNYSEADAEVLFTLSNGGKLKLVFSAEMGCMLFGEAKNRYVRTAVEFRRHFPIDIGVVPVLGPLEHDEPQVEQRTVQRNLQTHRASRNFRNYWHLSDDGDFEEFRQAVMDSWEGIDIEKPELSITTEGPNILHMYVREDRITRELHWMGFGFHVWLQIITHVLRNRDATILVIDEPETYMHPTLQRHLLALLRDQDTDCMLATHSSELVAEAERSEIVVVDKARRSGTRLAAGTHTDAYEALGSSFNYTLADVLRRRVAILVEGDSDVKLLQQLGRRMRPRLLVGTGTPPRVSLGGHKPDRAKYLAADMKTLVGPDVRLAIVLDRDYRCDEEVMALESQLLEAFDVARVLRRKEMENYFLSSSALRREIAMRAEIGRGEASLDADEILDRVTEDMREETESQCLSQYVAYGESVTPHKDRSTLTKEAMSRFRTQWETLDGRLTLVSGKVFLRNLNRALQEQGVKAFTTAQLASALSTSEIPREMATLLQQLEELSN